MRKVAASATTAAVDQITKLLLVKRCFESVRAKLIILGARCVANTPSMMKYTKNCFGILDLNWNSWAGFDIVGCGTIEGSAWCTFSTTAYFDALDL